jgi:hypothetical protein
MAPNGPEPSRITWSEHSVHFQYRESQCASREDYLCFLSPKKELLLPNRRMDPAGLEPTLSSRTDAARRVREGPYDALATSGVDGISTCAGSAGLVLVYFLQREPA